MSISFEPAAIAEKREDHSSLSPAEVMDIARAKEVCLFRLLMAYISSGLLFMLLPGTFLGVWNLLRISGRESIASVSPAWLQAHGHAQVFDSQAAWNYETCIQRGLGMLGDMDDRGAWARAFSPRSWGCGCCGAPG